MNLKGVTLSSLIALVAGMEIGAGLEMYKLKELKPEEPKYFIVGFGTTEAKAALDEGCIMPAEELSGNTFIPVPPDLWECIRPCDSVENQKWALEGDGANWKSVRILHMWYE